MGIAGLDQILEKGLERIDDSDDEQKTILLTELKARNYVPSSVEKEYMVALWAEFKKARSERKEKLEASFQGIPREAIAWFPKVDQRKCSGCTSCVEFCIHGVFHFSEGRSHVVRPYNCVVGNTTCRSFCPEKAISFPTHNELKDMLKTLKDRNPPGT